VDAALDLVEVMGGEGTLSAHAGVHAGPVIERDLDVFGQTVNLAWRIADVAPPGEVLASRAVVEQAGNGDAYCFEQIEDADLKGVPDSVPLFRVARSGSAIGP
jgi:class 3 adenylate cyclase